MTRIDDEQINALLRHLDHAAPRISAADVVARAARPAFSRARRWTTKAKAASIIIALSVAGAAYAIPGSPVRAWVEAAVSRFTRREAPGVQAPARRDSVTGGIAVAPGLSLAIRFASWQATGHVRVLLTDDAEVAVTAHNGAATFSSGSERLDVDNRGSAATFEIRIPRGAPLVSIEVAGTSLFSRRGAHTESRATPDSGGTYVLSLSPPP
jgi:hypothetical protein